jgi:hypothetical protein
MNNYEHKNLHFDIEQNIHMNPEIMRKVATTLIWIC